jgi:hypothetical protein
MVVFVGHTLLLSGIGLDVNDVSDMVVDQEGRQLDGAVVCARSEVRTPESINVGRTLEPPLEHVARTRAVTKGVRHLEDCASDRSSAWSTGATTGSIRTSGVGDVLYDVQSKQNWVWPGNSRVAGGVLYSCGCAEPILFVLLWLFHPIGSVELVFRRIHIIKTPSSPPTCPGNVLVVVRSA